MVPRGAHSRAGWGADGMMQDLVHESIWTPRFSEPRFRSTGGPAGVVLDQLMQMVLTHS